MNLKTLPLTVILLFSLAASSCKKENSDDLQKKADAFQEYLIGKHFIPIEFYADREIDYDQTDGVSKLETNLEDYILQYLKDDKIVFLQGGKLSIDQGPLPYVKGSIDDPDFPGDPKWSVTIKKATGEVRFQYLDYKYRQQTYILDHYDSTEILAHISWSGGGKTATLSTKFEKR
jgi:hypothetical protein